MAIMRNIPVPPDLYAAIWKAQKPGEETEEEILRRVFGVPANPPAPQSTSNKIGFIDPRFGIELPENFEIFRVYKGTEYRAKAVDGQWMLMSTGDMYSSLNQLSRAVTGKVENAWQNWYYLENGKRQLVTRLRK